MNVGPSPSSSFLAALAQSGSPRLRDSSQHIDHVLGEVFEQSRSARPGLAVPFDAFVTYLADRLPPNAESVDALRQLRVEDLYLACACSRGDAAAIALIDSTYLANLGSVVALSRGAQLADVIQVIREILLVGRDGRTPKIIDYSGRGDLTSWIRVVAVRTSLNLARGKNREVSLDENNLLADRAGTDVELGHLKMLYSSEFREAFRQSLATLSVRDRNMMRQHYIDGLPMERVAAIYQVHRVTVVRRMKEVRKELASETRRRMKAKLRVSHGELESIMRLIQSHLDVTLRAYLPDSEQQGDSKSSASTVPTSESRPGKKPKSE